MSSVSCPHRYLSNCTTFKPIYSGETVPLKGLSHQILWCPFLVCMGISLNQKINLYWFLFYFSVAPQIYGSHFNFLTQLIPKLLEDLYIKSPRRFYSLVQYFSEIFYHTIKPSRRTPGISKHKNRNTKNSYFYTFVSVSPIRYYTYTPHQRFSEKHCKMYGPITNFQKVVNSSPKHMQ